MAPKRGGGGGGGNGEGSGGSTTCPADADYPCTSEMYEMYGDVYTNTEQYGQVVLYSIWCLALILLFLRSWTLRKQVLWLKVAIVLFFISWVFVCVRFGLIIAQSNVPIGYRFESSVAQILWRLGMVALFAGCFPPDTGKWQGIFFRFGVMAYLCLSITYTVYDFIISSKALSYFKDDWNWWISDRDFGLTLNEKEIQRLTMRDEKYIYSPFYIWNFFVSSLSDEDNYIVNRGRQIKFGVAADFIALFLAVYTGVVAWILWVKRRRQQPGSEKLNSLLLIVAGGLIFPTLFRVIISTHYVLPNWKAVTTPEQWMDWINSKDVEEDQFGFENYSGGNLFLRGWRMTVDGFPIAQALLEPLGIVIACAGMVLWWRSRSKAVDRETSAVHPEYK
ncbi:hypothetical protein BDV96DRAFT_655197 [Lophiotrema nucula]|uniref:Uncharacterized protein n=1 Tax=Lophiotrema nucula TaxID=690887 RepID=A0A6A5YG53_9PLEO|nr:hypothetical protein BDV96DRAFT_655197 [Lophiotrema nucula]